MTKSATPLKSTGKPAGATAIKTASEKNEASRERADETKAPPVAGTPAHEREQTGADEKGALDKARSQTAQAVRQVSDAASSTRKRAAEVTGQMAEQASARFHSARSTLEESYETGTARAREAYDTTTRRAADFAREHPFALGAMGLVAGFALGALLPRTSREDRAFGERRDTLLHKAARTGEEALRQGRVKAEETLRTLREDDGMTDEERLEEGLEDTFPASDPVAATSITGFGVQRN